DQRPHQARVFDLGARFQPAPTPGLGRPFADALVPLDPDREDPPYTPVVHLHGFLRHVRLGLLRDHLEGDLLQMARTRHRIDAILEHAGVTGEVVLLTVTGEQVRRPGVTASHLGFEDVGKFAMPDGMRRLRRMGDHPLAADDLVASHLRLDQMVIDPGEGASARHPLRGTGARVARSFELVTGVLLVHPDNPTRAYSAFASASRSRRRISLSLCIVERTPPRMMM